MSARQNTAPRGAFAGLQPEAPDPLLRLIELFRDDPRPDKVDLGVGVYRDERGVTPVMDAVKAAERKLVETQASKSYLGPEGDPAFTALLAPLVFGPAWHGDIVGLQTPGGSGALRLGAELLALAQPGTTVHAGAPSWPNHHGIFASAGLPIASFPHCDVGRQSVAFEATRAALSRVAPGDVVLLHGCCHNPTGADYTPGQWDELAELLAQRRAIPFVDLAYQGLGDGLEADAAGLRKVFARVPDALAAISCDKNFGLYRDRVGALFVQGAEAASVFGTLLRLARVNWSMPPDHGAAVVRTVLQTADLRASWAAELDGMRQRVLGIRRALAAAHPRLAGMDRQRGFFSMLPVPPGAVEALRREHGIYMAPSGRANLAGLHLADVDRVVRALHAAAAW